MLSFELAFQLRFGFAVSAENRILFWSALPWVMAIKLLIFQRCGSLQGWWRYVTFADLVSLLRSSALSTLAIALVDGFWLGQVQLPRSVLVLDFSVTVLLVGGLRSLWRLARESLWPVFNLDRRRPALMIGADQGGEALARQIQKNPALNYQIVGYLDEDRCRRGTRLGGIPFLATPADGIAVATRHNVRDILVVAGSIGGKRLRRLVEECREAGIRLKMIPRVDELLDGSLHLRTRDVDINDLLRRKPVQLDTDAIARMLDGKRVMVTGAGGSIGSEICRQILKHGPEGLILVERAENNLFFIEQELDRLPTDASFFLYAADVGDRERMRTLFRRHRPQIVFHAAANKHVPLMETNPGEAIKNNVLGTKVVADLADECAAERFVLISTDKAVNPSNVMGLTKQMAERYVQAIAGTSATTYVVVRFGNVLGSTASVVPIFQEQIRRGGPITITHPEMQRYFMTIPEAAQLVLEAAAMGDGGEVFVLDMGEPIKIIDLAHDLIRLSGLSAADIRISVIGPRAGEKLVEEMYHEEEATLPTPHPKLRVAHHRPCSPAKIHRLVAELAAVVDWPEDAIRRRLMELAGGYGLTGLGQPVGGPLAVRHGNGRAGDGNGDPRKRSHHSH